MKTLDDQINVLETAKRRAQQNKSDALENIERIENDLERMRGQVFISDKFIEGTDKAIAVLEGADNEEDSKSV